MFWRATTTSGARCAMAMWSRSSTSSVEAERMADDPLRIGDRTYRSRLIVGTGKYRDFAETRAAIEASGAEIVTVAVRRVNITEPGKENLLDHLDMARITILPNTAGCYTAAEAI